MNRSLATLQRAFSCLGHGSRLRIVLALLERPRFVTELAVEVELSQSCTTRHLQALAAAGLVHGRRSGKRVIFEVDRGAPLFAALEALETVGVTQGSVLTTGSRPGRAGPKASTEASSVDGLEVESAARRAATGRPTRAAVPPVSSRPPISPDLEDFLL